MCHFAGFRSSELMSALGWNMPVLNAVINPFIYALRIPIFRKSFLLILRCQWDALRM